jgi:hypothetical protein
MMKKQILTLLTFVVFNSLLIGQDTAGTVNQALSTRIDAMAVEGQKYRNKRMELKNLPVPNEQELLKAGAEIEWIDSLNLIRAKEVFAEFGYPGGDLVGQESSHHFWLIIQHCDGDPEFQERVLSAMEVQVKRGNADAKNYAYLRDRVLVNTGQLQIYGTQMQLNGDSTSFEPKPLIEPEKTNDRRQEVGLGPIDEYIFTMNQVYHGVLKKKD